MPYSIRRTALNVSSAVALKKKKKKKKKKFYFAKQINIGLTDSFKRLWI